MFSDLPDGARQLAERIHERSSEAFRRAFIRSINKGWIDQKAILRIADHKDLLAKDIFQSIEKAITPAGEGLGGASSCLEQVLCITSDLPPPPPKELLKDKLSNRRKAAKHIRKAIAELAGDDDALRMNLVGFVDLCRKSADNEIAERATISAWGIHYMPPLAVSGMQRGMILSDLLSELADRMDKAEPLHYGDVTIEFVKVPQGREGRNQLWIERRLTELMERFTGAPRDTWVADLVNASMGADMVGDDVKRHRLRGKDGGAAHQG